MLRSFAGPSVADWPAAAPSTGRTGYTEVAQRIRAYQARYEIDTIIIDNSNKQAVEEMRRRH